MVVCVDVDCVLNNLTHEWVKALNKTHNLKVEYESIKEWSLQSVYPSLNESELFKPLDNEDFFENLKPFPESQYYLKRLINEGCEVYLATASHYTTVKWKVEWLKKYFPFVDVKHIIFTHKKQMLNCDILVDDYEKNLIEGKYDGILVNQPWNENFYENGSNIVRAYDWQEIYSLINKKKTEEKWTTK